MEQKIREIQNRKIKALDKWAKNHKEAGTETVKSLVEIIDMAVEELRKSDKNEVLVKDAAIKATGEIEIAIDDYRFIKNDAGIKKITIYKVCEDGNLEFIDRIELCEALEIALDSISSMKAYVENWYLQNKDTLIRMEAGYYQVNKS